MYWTVCKVKNTFLTYENSNNDSAVVEEWEKACLFALLAMKRGRVGNHLPWREYSGTVLSHQHAHRIDSAEREPLFKPFLPFHCLTNFVFHLLRRKKLNKMCDPASVHKKQENRYTLQLQLQLHRIYKTTGPLKHIYNYSSKLL